MPETELEVLEDIRREIQAGFLALIFVVRQIRDKQGKDPRALSDFEDAAGILASAFEIVRRRDG